MDTLKWLVKNYPKSCGLISERFDNKIIDKYMKKLKYKPAILQKDIRSWEANYSKGTLFLFRRVKSYEDGDVGDGYYDTGWQWNGEFDSYGLFECGNITISGYQHISVDYENMSLLDK